MQYKYRIGFKMSNLGLEVTKSGWFWCELHEQKERPFYYNELQNNWKDSFDGNLVHTPGQCLTVIRECL